MGGRTTNSTTLSFGLVSAPVSLKKIVSEKEAKGTSIESATPEGHKAGYAWVDKEGLDKIAGEALANGTQPDPAALGELMLPFEHGDKGKVLQRPRKGVFSGGAFVEIPADQLSLIDEQTKLQEIEIAGFIPLAEVPFERTIDAYYLAPGGKNVASTKPLALLRDGLHDRKAAGFGRVTIRTNTYPFVIYEKDGGIVLNIQRYAQTFDLAVAAEAISGVQTDDKTRAMAATLIDQLTVDRVNYDGIKNDRVEAREQVIAQVLAGEQLAPVETVAVEEAGIDLEAMLAASIGATADKKPAGKAKVAA